MDVSPFLKNLRIDLRFASIKLAKIVSCGTTGRKMNALTAITTIQSNSALALAVILVIACTHAGGGEELHSGSVLHSYELRDDPHERLLKELFALNFEVPINPDECWQRFIYGAMYFEQRKIVLCQYGLEGKTVKWTDFNLLVLRHEAHHVVQSCENDGAPKIVRQKAKEIEEETGVNCLQNPKHCRFSFEQLVASCLDPHRVKTIKEICTKKKYNACTDIELEADAIARCFGPDYIVTQLQEKCRKMK